jgi:hypothetical protein
VKALFPELIHGKQNQIRKTSRFAWKKQWLAVINPLTLIMWLLFPLSFCYNHYHHRYYYR